MKYSSYPNYKDSGVEWLSDIPSNWDIWKLNHFSSIITCGVASTPEYVDNGVKFLSAQNIINNKVDLKKGYKYITEKKHAELTNIRTVKNGDLLMSRVGTIGNTCIVDVDFDFSIFVSLTHLRLNNIICNNIFFVYLTESKYFRELNASETLVGGGVGNLNVNDLREYKLPLPSLQEQQTIANYLDRATTKIDTLIEKQTKLIALLKEKRQAVISTAVTRGLDPSVPMKDSGVEWLGEIPEGWNAVSLKYISRITLGKMLTSTDKGNMKFKPYLKAKNLRWMKVDVKNVDNMWFSDAEITSLRLKKNDLLVSEGGEVGRTCIWNNELDECYIQNSVNRVQFTKHNSRFFLYQFFSAGHYGYFDSIVNKISIAHLTKEKLGDAKFVNIPLMEQQAIVSYLDDKTSKIDTLTTKATKAIDLLKEKRTALISSVVTGKIDVRGVAV